MVYKEMGPLRVPIKCSINGYSDNFTVDRLRLRVFLSLLNGMTRPTPYGYPQKTSGLKTA